MELCEYPKFLMGTLIFGRVWENISDYLDLEEASGHCPAVRVTDQV